MAPPALHLFGTIAWGLACCLHGRPPAAAVQSLLPAGNPDSSFHILSQLLQARMSLTNSFNLCLWCSSTCVVYSACAAQNKKALSLPAGLGLEAAIYVQHNPWSCNQDCNTLSTEI